MLHRPGEPRGHLLFFTWAFPPPTLLPVSFFGTEFSYPPALPPPEPRCSPASAPARAFMILCMPQDLGLSTGPTTSSPSPSGHPPPSHPLLMPLDLPPPFFRDDRASWKSRPFLPLSSLPAFRQVATFGFSPPTHSSATVIFVLCSGHGTA